jgi:hypothetical protein
VLLGLAVHAPAGLEVATVTLAGTIAPATAFGPERGAAIFRQVSAGAAADRAVEVGFTGARGTTGPERVLWATEPTLT